MNFDPIYSELFIKHFPWVLSAVSVYQTFLAGNKSDFTWKLMCYNQIAWFLWIFLSANWGFLPLNICMAYMGIINHRKWVLSKINEIMPENHLTFTRVTETRVVSVGWKPIDPTDSDAPWGDKCILINNDAGIEALGPLSRREEFYTHYQPFSSFKRDTN